MELRPGYIESECGVIPEDWETSTIGALGTFSKGAGIKKNETTSGDIPCVRYGEIYTHHNDIVRDFNSRISPAVAATSKRLKRGDILFAGSGETKEEIGKSVAFVCDGEAYAGGDIVILSPQRTDSCFLGYLLNSPSVARQKASKGQGDAVVHISAKALSSISIPLPPTEAEQRAIATALSDVDALLDGLDGLITKKRDIKQAAMQQLLTGKTRLPGFEEEWDVKRLGDIAELNRQNVVPAAQPNELFLHFSLPAFDEGKSAPIEAGSLIGSNKFRVPKGAVLLSKLNPRIPRVWAPVDIPDNSVASTEWLVLTPHEGVDRSFLYWACSSRDFSQKMELNATGTTGSHQRISPKTALDIEVLIAPSEEEQYEVASVFFDMELEIQALEKRRAKTANMKQAMMQELLTGRTRLV